MNEAKKENREGLVLKVGRFLKRIAIGVYRVPKSLAIRVYHVLKNLAVTVYRVLKRIVISVYRFLNVFTSDRDLTWLQRACVYGGALVLGLVVARCFTASFLCLLGINPHSEYPVIHPKIPAGIFLFGLVVSVGTWIIRTADAKKQFADTLRTQTNTAFIEAVRLLVEGQSASARGAGLAEMAHLLHHNPEYKERVELVTASGLRLGEEDLSQSEKQEVGGEEDSPVSWRQEAGNKASIIKLALSGANLSGLQMPNADLRGARLHKANLVGVDLSQALLQEARLDGANLQKANLQEACLSDTHFKGADLRRADLQEANLDAALLVKAELQDIQLRAANAGMDHRLDSFQATRVPGPNFQGAKLGRASLVLARLPNANFKGADLRRADLQGAELQEADWKDALYSETTKFPDGFDPDAAGMKLVEDDDDKN